MTVFKNAQISQSSQTQKFKTGILCLALIGLTTLSGLSGKFYLIPVVVFAIVLAFVEPYLVSTQKTKELKQALLATIGVLSAGLFQLMSPTAAPAHGQFMNKVQEFFVQKFVPANGSLATITHQTALIALTFNVLRAIYVVYLAVSLIGVFNRIRNDKDWITAARTPLLVWLSIFIGDLLFGLITPA